MSETANSKSSDGLIDKLNVPLSDGEGDDTEVGNYFVANYPPFSFWDREDKEQKQIHEVLNSPTPKDTNLGVYFHIPFCRKRCHFCYFRVYTDKNSNEINAYLDAGIKEFERYAQTSYLAGRKPQFVYFGGGTPSYLSIKQLTDLTNRMKDSFSWDEAEEVAFECEPGTLTEKKLEALRDIGVTRLSLGIENFDDHILEVNGRAHRSKEAFRALGFANTLGFDQVNIDLIAGMMDETEDNWKRCVETAIEQSPDCVTIYQMEIPYNTTIYKEMKSSGRITAPVANWQTKRRWVDWAFDQFQDAGYTVNSAYTVVKNPETTKFIYRDSLWEGADLLSAGVASFGHFGGDNWKRCVETAIEQSPDCVTIYQMEIPYNTTIYKEMKSSGRITAPVANWQTKRRWVDWAFDQFQDAGYTVNSAYTVVKNPETTKFIYRDSLWEGADLLSAGVASFGHFGGVHYQNQADVGPYMTQVDSGELPIFRSYKTNAEERFIREFVLQLKLGRTSLQYFKDKYGVDPEARFPAELAALKEQGYFSIDKGDIVVSRDGLLQIDRLLHGFFLEEHRDARYT